MPSIFAVMDEVLDGELADPVTILPMQHGDFADAPDPDRPQLRCLALVSDGEITDAAPAGGKLHVPDQMITVDIRRPLLGDLVLRKGDRIRLDAWPGTPSVIVNRIDRLDKERVLLVCGEIRS